MLPGKKPHPSSIACLPCRDKHVKCDAQVPVCARCANSGITCIFVESRRGRRRPKVRNAHGQPTPPSSNSVLLDRPPQDQPPLSHVLPVDEETSQVASSSVDTAPSPVSVADDGHLIQLYYQYIHPAHPFVLPYKLYKQNPSVFPSQLRKAMCFIASHHSSSAMDLHYDAPDAALSPDITENAFKVQALILVTLASYARFERDKGNATLNAAIDVACRTGLGCDDFGRDHEPIYRESWRRTWWELYTVTGLISLIGGTNLRLAQPAGMTLPCACEAYDACQVCPVGTSEDMQERFHAESPPEWSSFAYRIEAMRILATVLEITDESSPAKCDAASASISGYLLSLPQDKQEGIRADGEVDEVMSCALMIIHLASICLNLPRSTMAHLRGFKTVCGNDRGTATSETPRTHQLAALRSAKGLAKLISSRSTLKTLSPCFSCAIAFSAVVQLSEFLSHKPSETEYLKENLQLELGALQFLGNIWPIARVVRGQIAQFAREVMSKPATIPLPASISLSLIDPYLTDDQWLNNLISEDMML